MFSVLHESKLEGCLKKLRWYFFFSSNTHFILQVHKWARAHKLAILKLESMWWNEKKNKNKVDIWYTWLLSQFSSSWAMCLEGSSSQKVRFLIYKIKDGSHRAPFEVVWIKWGMCVKEHLRKVIVLIKHWLC